VQGVIFYFLIAIISPFSSYIVRCAHAVRLMSTMRPLCDSKPQEQQKLQDSPDIVITLGMLSCFLQNLVLIFEDEDRTIEVKVSVHFPSNRTENSNVAQKTCLCFYRKKFALKMSQLGSSTRIRILYSTLQCVCRSCTPKWEYLQ
jgi:hypothetical protein